MIKIVTGKINSFKTTRLLNLYRKDQLGGGFVAIKKMNNDLVFGYWLMNLQTEEMIPYIIRDIYHQNDKEIKYQIGPYRFYKDAFDYIDILIEDLLEKNLSPVYLDEISILELQGEGLYGVMEKLLLRRIDLVIVVRTDLLERVIEYFKISDYQIIE
jgi:nucleoside-triphosphatase THEP1